MIIMRFFSNFIYKGICCGYSFELHRQVDAIQMSTHNMCLYKEVKKKYTGCDLKTTEFLDCALIGVCAVIRSNTVFITATADSAVWLLWNVSRISLKCDSFYLVRTISGIGRSLMWAKWLKLRSFLLESIILQADKSLVNQIAPKEYSGQIAQTGCLIGVFFEYIT